MLPGGGGGGAILYRYKTDVGAGMYRYITATNCINGKLDAWFSSYEMLKQIIKYVFILHGVKFSYLE